MDTRQIGWSHRWRAVHCFILVALAISACKPQSLPAPMPDTLQYGMANGAIADSGQSWIPVQLHWTPALPVEVGRDRYEIVFMTGSGQRLISHIIENGSSDHNVIRYGSAFPLYLTRQRESGPDDFQHLDLQVECGQTYGWRVRQLRANAVGDWSETWTFQIGSSPAESPVQSWPAEGERIRGGQLTWNPLAGARPEIMYEYEISGARNISGMVFFSRESHSPDLLLEQGSAAVVGLHNEQRYYWHVRAYYSPDCAGPWSPMRMFIWDGASAELLTLPPPSPICPPGSDCAPADVPPPTWTPLVATLMMEGLVPAINLTTSTPEPSFGLGLSLQSLTCRTGPGTFFPISSYLAAGENAEILGRSLDGTWLLVRSCTGSEPAWVYGKLIELKFDPSGLPFIAGPPTPTPTDEPPTPLPFSCSAAYGTDSACNADSRCAYDYLKKICVNK